MHVCACIGYETDLPTFLQKVEEDAVAFKPYGTKVYEYTKVFQPPKSDADDDEGEGEDDNEEAAQPEEPKGQPSIRASQGEEVHYEVWHVRLPHSCLGCAMSIE